jgi:hypothetical protein
MKFKKHHFDALSTLSQIIILQNFSFATLSLSIIMSLSILNLAGVGSKLDLKFLLDFSMISANTLLGWSLTFVYLTHALLTLPLAMLFIVKRSRLCLDFGCTIWGLHILLGWYSIQ